MFRAILIIAIVFIVNPAEAKRFSVAAIVNGDAITAYSLYERIAITIKSSGIEDSDEIRRSMLPQVLQLMINELLQKQDAEKIGVKVSEKDMELAIADLEKKNGLDSGGFDAFVEQKGISKRSILSQIRAQILWKKIVNRVVAPRVVISDYEVKEMISSLSSGEKSFEVYLSEIIITIVGNEKNALNLAQKIIKEAKSGDFLKIAKQLQTEGSTIGWLPEAQLNESLQDLVKNAKVNDILPPIRTEDAFRIIKVGGKRVSDNIPNPDAVRDFLLQQKISLESKRYLKNLRQKAFIEIR